MREVKGILFYSGQLDAPRNISTRRHMGRLKMQDLENDEPGHIKDCK